jgi:hypothetical protein
MGYDSKYNKKSVKRPRGVLLTLVVGLMVGLMGLTTTSFRTVAPCLPDGGEGTVASAVGSVGSTNHHTPFEGIYRLAEASLCHGATTEYAPASMKPKVAQENAVKVARGGYSQIGKGSAEVDLVGLFVTFISKIQHEHGIYGSVGELGVHHGRFTSTLFITARENEKLIDERPCHAREILQPVEIRQ